MPFSFERPLLVVASILVAGAAISGCGSKSTSPPVAARPALAVITVTSTPVPLERIVDGTIEAVNQATVSAQTGGRIVEILYDVNDVVPAGAVLVRLKGIEQRAGLQSAEAALAEARSRSAEAQANFDRISDMYQRRVVSKAQFDQASASHDAAAARLAAAEAGVTAAREGVGYTEVRAPYGGVVTKRLVEVGETVGPGTPLMTGLSLKDLRVSTYVPQSVAMDVRRTRKAAIYVDGKRIDSSKITIFPEAATPSSTFRARIELPSGAVDAAPGTYVRVGLVTGVAPRIVVPATALVERGEVTGVYVVDAKGAVSLRYVRPGRRVGEGIEILSGLVAGEQVALDPTQASVRATSTGATS